MRAELFCARAPAGPWGIALLSYNVSQNWVMHAHRALWHLAKLLLWLKGIQCLTDHQLVGCFTMFTNICNTGQHHSRPSAATLCHCRSLAACEQLSKAGYQEVAWINGGFDTAQKDDLPVANASDMRFGGIGGLSEFLGWTDVQRQNTSSEGFLGGFQNVLKLVSAAS